MDLYHKPTDTRRCVPFSSNHPSHCKRNIPFSLARRICTITENENDKIKHINELKQNLINQEYPKKLIDASIIKAQAIPQNELRKPKVKTNENILPFVTTHNPNNPEIFPTIKTAFNTLVNNKIHGFDKNFKLIQSRRQSPNLKQILTKAEFSNQNNGVYKCKDKRCECCNYLKLGESHTFKNSHITFKLKSRMDCDSSNIIYVIICPGCKEEYIGETGKNNTKLRDRVRVYRQHIRQQQYQMLQVEEHLRICGNGRFEIFPFLQIRTDDVKLRRTYETMFQEKHKTSLNKL